MAGPAAGPARLGLVGVGLIGGSAGLAARQAWPDVHRVGIDNAEAIDLALAHGCIDSHAPSVEALADCDLILLAAPVPAILELLAAWPGSGEAVITDTGSTKRRISAAGRHLSRFVPGHPIAGAELPGLAQASPDLFCARDWVLTPHAGSDPDAVAHVESFVRGLGARPVRLEADAHDRTMAYVSHAPQVLSVALMNAAVGAGALDSGLTGGGFRDMTRLAAASSELWQGILETNLDYVDEALEAVRAAMPAGGRPLDASAVASAFAQANEGRRRMTGDGGARRDR